MSNFNFSQNQMDQLLHMASKKMGTDPENLKQQMQNGSYETILNGLPSPQAAQIRNFMSNPQALEQLMNSPKVRELLQGLMGKN